MIFLRNNGIYIYIASTILFIFIYIREYGFCFIRPIFISSCAIVLVYVILTGPVYNYLKWNDDEKVESYGILLEQVGYIEVTNGVISEEDQIFLDNLIPKERLKEVYNPMSIDRVKWDEQFNQNYLNDHSLEFLEVWLRLVYDNLVLAFKEYCLATYGFWSTYKTTKNGYSSLEMWNDRYSQRDLFAELTGFSIRDIIKPKRYVSYALYFWIVLLFAVILLHKGKVKYFLPLFPSLFGWFTIMIATPCAFSFRYVYYLFLLPMYIIAFVEGIMSGE